MINICMFVKYKVKRTNTYSYISDKIGSGWDREYIYSDDKTETEEIIDGGKLMEWISNDMNDSDTIGIKFIDGKKTTDFEVQIEQFNPNTGEGGNILYNIEYIPEDKLKKIKKEKNNGTGNI